MPAAASGVLGHFRVGRKLGAGGMGLVCAGIDVDLRRPVALKFILGDHARDRDFRERFLCEARTAASLSHPNICTIYETGETPGDGELAVDDMLLPEQTPYIAMELIEGQTLAMLLATRGRLSPAEAVPIALQVAEGMAAAHRQGIVHRDLKPANVMLTAGGVVKILDFGLARRTAGGEVSEDTGTAQLPSALTRPGLAIGTVAYMSPEQVRGEPVDSRSDIFSFGALLYEMLVGRMAFGQPSTAEMVAAVLREEPQVPGDVPVHLRRIIERCLRKLPSDRFQAASDLIAELTGALEHSSQSVSETTTSIAVLPFRVLSAAEEDTFFGEGLAEELINALTRVPGLRVTARTSAFSFQGKNLDVREIAANLGVRHVLEGSLRRSGSRLRVSARLVDAREGYEVWAERFEREMTDIFAIQDDISQAIASKLRTQFAVTSAPATAVHKPTHDLEAYELYLRGRALIYKWTPETIQASREYFDAALQRDPEFALAWESRAELYWYLGFFAVLAPREAFSASLRAVLRAVEIDDSLGESHALLGMLRKELEYDWAAVDREFECAFALSPESSTVLLRHSVAALMPTGRIAEAIEEATRVIEADPLSTFARWWLGLYHLLARDFTAAREQGNTILGIDPSYHLGHSLAGLASMFLGDFDHGISACENASRFSAQAPLFEGFLGWAYGVANREADARRVLERLRDPARPGWTPPTSRAWIHVALGEIDQALEEIERAIDERDPIIIPILTFPHLDPLRSDPRFPKLLAKMGLDREPRPGSAS